MQFLLPVVLLLTTLTFANPLPAPVSPVPNLFTAITPTTHDHAELAWQKCLELNIDPNGPHPDNFIQDKIGRRFEGGRISTPSALSGGDSEVTSGNHHVTPAKNAYRLVRDKGKGMEGRMKEKICLMQSTSYEHSGVNSGAEFNPNPEYCPIILAFERSPQSLSGMRMPATMLNNCSLLFGTRCAGALSHSMDESVFFGAYMQGNSYTPALGPDLKIGRIRPP
ncbi:hypothetical protein K440DRAFT_684219 [Wilcoxina mikolae CBS 423.85]|nr:hypothetical protein K440DRAFT_684219 [Wilcoxina mikolae CBS 423.85]